MPAATAFRRVLPIERMRVEAFGFPTVGGATGWFLRRRSERRRAGERR